MHPLANNWEIPRFHVPDHTASDSAELGGAQRDYLHSVLRFSPGDRVRLYDGEGDEALCEISGFTRRECSLRVFERFRYVNRPAAGLTLCFSLLKKGLGDEIVAQCSQLGVTRFQPLITERTQARPAKQARQKMIRRFAEIATQAAGRAMRSDVPSIADIMDLHALAGSPSSEASVFLYEGGGSLPLGAAVSELAPDAGLRLLIGPEGGFALRELEALEDSGFHRTAFGRRILKAHTAAVAAVSVVMETRGELGPTEDI